MLIGDVNIAAGWIEMVFGILSGSLIGFWSFNGPFKTPKGYENYAMLPRRLTRLGHIACFALPIISILYGHHIDAINVSDQLKVLGAYSWIVCMVGVPLLLFLASFYEPFKYLEVIPVTAGTFALALMSYGYLDKVIGF